jgi:hypothetical protein
LWWKKENVVAALDFDASGAAPLCVEIGLDCEGWQDALPDNVVVAN